MTNGELTSHVDQRAFEGVGPADNILNDNACIRVVVDRQARRFSELLPNAIDVVDEIDEGRWPIGWSKRHNCVSPFDGVDPLKRQLLLTCKVHSELMVAHRRVEHPPPKCAAKLVEYRGVATWD